MLGGVLLGIIFSCLQEDRNGRRRSLQAGAGVAGLKGRLRIGVVPDVYRLNPLISLEGRAGADRQQSPNYLKARSSNRTWAAGRILEFCGGGVAGGGQRRLQGTGAGMLHAAATAPVQQDTQNPSRP